MVKLLGKQSISILSKGDVLSGQNFHKKPRDPSSTRNNLLCEYKS